ncbi:hypothetical protein ADUPG1_000827 [Aduncisulcus paluster]|uniref:Uncharacterized protein n=1 Tax=Aduncisulcus paluster TaxID=2918883 RepID=A0ABQ5KA20_9EUKA|nr:hypothetical protein ADUPG1_000827 [Aduncisulcus paluster]
MPFLHFAFDIFVPQLLVVPVIGALEVIYISFAGPVSESIEFIIDPKNRKESTVIIKSTLFPKFLGRFRKRGRGLKFRLEEIEKFVIFPSKINPKSQELTLVTKKDPRGMWVFEVLKPELRTLNIIMEEVFLYFGTPDQRKEIKHKRKMRIEQRRKALEKARIEKEQDSQSKPEEEETEESDLKEMVV